MNNKKTKNCDDKPQEYISGIPLSNHKFVETYNDGKMSVVKCEVCGVEETSWTDKATTDVV